MPLQNLVAVALRLVALNFVLRAITQSLPTIISLFSSPSGHWIAWIALAGLLVTGTAIWFLARPISRWVTRGSNCEVSLGLLSLANCYCLVFFSVGLVTLTRFLPTTMTWIHYLFKMAGTHPGTKPGEEFSYYDAAEAIMPSIIGVYLIYYARSFATRLCRFHTQPNAER